MKKAVMATLIGLSFIACPILYFLVGPKLIYVQAKTIAVLGIIAGCSALYCFITGEITRNNSQMDKLWSILPAVYTWVIAIMGGTQIRLVVMACIATVWGARLTFNFARKGAYKLRFWEGEEDYRWKVLRAKKEFMPRWKWTLFDLFFISIYQNALVLATTLPALICMGSYSPLNWIDFVAMGLMLGFIVLETVADEQQWKFQEKKKKLLAEGKKLEDLPMPYRRGFNTTGLWAHSRHPNYFAEQCIWISFYVFSIGAGIAILNWSIVGALLLIVLFMGSSDFGEEISSSKYPRYKDYKKKVSKFIPWFSTMDK